MLPGILVPLILLLYRPTRLFPFWRMLALAMVVGGVVVFRHDINIVGQFAVISGKRNSKL